MSTSTTTSTWTGMLPVDDTALLARNPNLGVSAKTASNHGNILRKDSRAVAQAVREVAAS